MQVSVIRNTRIYHNIYLLTFTKFQRHVEFSNVTILSIYKMFIIVFLCGLLFYAQTHWIPFNLLVSRRHHRLRSIRQFFLYLMATATPKQFITTFCPVFIRSAREPRNRRTSWKTSNKMRISVLCYYILPLQEIYGKFIQILHGCTKGIALKHSCAARVKPAGVWQQQNTTPTMPLKFENG